MMTDVIPALHNWKSKLSEREKVVEQWNDNGSRLLRTYPFGWKKQRGALVPAERVVVNKRFLPSDFGCEEDRISVLPPFQAFLDKKKRIRRAIEAAGIPYTYVSANCFGAYFVNYLLRPHEKHDNIIVYGNGEAKALPDPENIPGVTMNFELGDNDIEASRLYPDMQFATVEQLLDVFLHDPPKSASAAFA
ncbi:hypothetical protein RJ639_000616 [Escallonia herrerae]|uniref:NmrA-like domain-containing protein n=1 Tax=Escallonia herrerae TaxID=1293975 RepID=A0AA88XC73_9ASTE|nr:hypothetical protein RJ639_000616 [Escallonia herrerae]